MRLTKTRKLQLILLFSLPSSVYLILVGDKPIYGTWDYGFHIDTFEAPNTGTTVTESYAKDMHEWSFIYTTFSDIMTTILGIGLSWLYIPMIAVIAVMIYTYIQGYLQSLEKYDLLALVVSIAGPYPLFGYYYNFRRDPLAPIFIFSFLIMVKLVWQNRMPRWHLVVASPLLSFIIWFNHYSIWPFFVITAVLVVLALPPHDWLSNISIASLLALPFVLRPVALRLLLGGGLSRFAILLKPSELIKLLSNTFYGQKIQAPSDGLIVSSPPDPAHLWLSTGTYLTVAIAILAISIVWIRPLLISLYQALKNPRSLLDDDDLIIPAAVLIAITIIALSYIVRGYAYRSVILWVFGLPALVITLARTAEFADVDEIANIKHKNIIIVFLVALVVVFSAPLLTPSDFDSDKSSAYTSPQQIESAEWVSNMDETVITDLTHASMMILHTDHRDIRTGYGASLDSNTVAVDSTLKHLYQPETDDCTLASYNGTYGVRTGGSAIPLMDIDNHADRNQIYDNGMDAWHCN